VTAQGSRASGGGGDASVVDDVPPLGECTMFINASHMGAALRRTRAAAAETEDDSSSRFPTRWGPEPSTQTRDYRQLPEGHGYGSGTLAGWIQTNLDNDAAATATGAGAADDGIISTNSTNNSTSTTTTTSTTTSSSSSSTITTTTSSSSSSSTTNSSSTSLDADDDVLLSVPLTLPDDAQFAAQLAQYQQYRQYQQQLLTRPRHLPRPRPPLRLSSNPGAVSVSLSLELYPGAGLSLADVTASLEFRLPPSTPYGDAVTTTNTTTNSTGEGVNDEGGDQDILPPSSSSSSSPPLVSVQLLRGERPDGTYVAGSRLEFATFSDAAPRNLPRAERYPSLLIDAIAAAGAGPGQAPPDEDAAAAPSSSSNTDPFYYYKYNYHAGSHRPEQSITRELQRAAAASAADAAAVAGEVGGGETTGSWNMTSGGEWRLVIRGGGEGFESLKGFEGDLGKLIFWSVKLCGTNPDYDEI
jgi:hypothetical protein